MMGRKTKIKFIVGQLYKLTRQMYGFKKRHVVVITEVDNNPTSKNRIEITTTDPVGDPEFDSTLVGKYYERYLQRYFPE